VPAIRYLVITLAGSHTLQAALQKLIAERHKDEVALHLGKAHILHHPGRVFPPKTLERKVLII